MQYVIGFSVGCIFTAVAMGRFALKFSGFILESLSKDLKEIKSKFEIVEGAK